MHPLHHSARQQHGFYVINVTTGTIVQYKSQPVIESSLGLDELATRSDSEPGTAISVGASDSHLRPIDYTHSRR